jgi:colicin import membrane protein
MMSLLEHIDGLDLRDWASLTLRTAQSAVEAAKQCGQEPPADLLAISKLSESELIGNRQHSTHHPERRPQTLRHRLTEAHHVLELDRQRAHQAEQDKQDAVADAAAARTEAATALAAAEQARELTRAAREDLAAKELQRTVDQRQAQQELEELRNQMAKARADATAADARAADSAKAAEAAKEREVAALDKFAKQASQLAGEQRQVELKLESSQAEVEKLRAELDRVRSDAGTQIAAAVEKASAAQQRAEERIAERAADRQEAEAENQRLRAELGRVRSDAEAELAATKVKLSAAQDQAHLRMTERTADRAAAQARIDELEAHVTLARGNASDEVARSREQAALAIAAAGQNMDATIERARDAADQQVAEAHEQIANAHRLLGDTQRQLHDAEQARKRAEAAADVIRASAAEKEQLAAHNLAIPVPGWEVRPATRHIENALTVLHQINYVLEVGMAEEVEAEIPVNVDMVRNLVRTALRQVRGLTQEFNDLPVKFIDQSQAQSAASYVDAAATACRSILLRIASAAEHRQNRDQGPDAEAVTAVIDMLYDPDVQRLVPEWIGDQESQARPN